MVKVSGATSTSTGAPPQKRTQLAEAVKVRVGTMTSSPGPMPAAKQAAWRAAVPLETAVAYLAPTFWAIFDSNDSIVGPWVIQPECNILVTVLISELSIHCRPYGM